MFKEVGRMTITTFNKLYKHYRDTFDLELRLRNSNTTYAEAYRKAQEQDRWLK